MENSVGKMESEVCRKYYTSAAVYYTNFGFGCVINFISPLVIAFSQKFETDVKNVSFVFTVLTASYLLAALTSAFVYRHVNRHACVIFLMAIVSTAIFVMPHVTSIHTFYFLGFLMGFGGGGCDTALITWIIELWRNQAAPFILTQHFSYSVGTIVPPLLLGPYLSHPNSTLDPSNVTPTPAPPPIDFATLSTPFQIAGFLMASTAICHIILFFRLRSTKLASSSPDRESLLESTSNWASSEQPSPSLENPPAQFTQRILTLIVLSCCTIGFYQAQEMMSFQFIPTFSVYTSLGLSQSKGAQILFGLTLAFAFGRGLGILLVLKIPPDIILWFNFSIILVANLVLYLLGQGSLSWMWIGAILLGLGMSTVFPAFYSYIEKHLHITNGIVAAITVTGGGVSAIYPLIVGHYIEKNPSILNYMVFCSLTVIVTCFGIIRWLTSESARRRSLSMEPL